MMSVAFSDGTFATPFQTAPPPYDYGANGPGSPWAFYGGAGVSGNGSKFTIGNPNVSAPSQVAFLPNNGNMSQSFNLQPGNYSISFEAAQRQNLQSSFQAVGVWLDNALVDVVVPATTGYTSYQSMNFSVAGTGLHTLVFRGLNPLSGDNNAFVTNVQINGPASTSDPNEPTVLADARRISTAIDHLTSTTCWGCSKPWRARCPRAAFCPCKWSACRHLRAILERIAS